MPAEQQVEPSIHNLSPRQLSRFAIAISLAQRAIKEGNVDEIAMIAIGEVMPPREKFETPSTAEWQAAIDDREPTRGITISSTAPPVTSWLDIDPYTPY